MKKLAVLFFLTLLVATPVLASNENSNRGRSGEDNRGRGEQKENAAVVVVTPNPSASPKVEDEDENEDEGDCDGDFKNHGQFVSCVAKRHEGGEEVSEAARSEIGKKHHSPSPSVSPVASVSASPFASASASPTASPEFSPSPFASVSASPSATVSASPVGVEGLAALNIGIEDLVKSLKHLGELINNLLHR